MWIQPGFFLESVPCLFKRERRCDAGSKDVAFGHGQGVSSGTQGVLARARHASSCMIVLRVPPLSESWRAAIGGSCFVGARDHSATTSR